LQIKLCFAFLRRARAEQQITARGFACGNKFGCWILMRGEEFEGAPSATPQSPPRWRRSSIGVSQSDSGPVQFERDRRRCFAFIATLVPQGPARPTRRTFSAAIRRNAAKALSWSLSRPGYYSENRPQGASCWPAAHLQTPDPADLNVVYPATTIRGQAGFE